MAASAELLQTALVSASVHDYAPNVESFISRADADQLRAAGAVVVKVTVDIANEFGSPEEGAGLRRQIRERLKGLPAFLLSAGADGRHTLFEIAPENLAAHTAEEIIAAVRQADICRVLEVSGSRGNLTLPANHHFVTPSGVHTTKFLRIADLMQDLSRLDLFAYWLKPYVTLANAVLADNWNITPVVLRTLTSLSRGSQIPFDFLPGHVIHEPAQASRIVERLLRKIRRQGHVLCVLSAHGSGRYIKRIRELFAAAGAPESCIPLSLARYADADKTIPTLFNLPFDTGIVGDDQACRLCERESVPVRVDPHLYYVRERRESKLMIGAKHFTNRAFLDSYADIPGVLNIHRNDPHDGRHHAYYIDVKSLLGSPRFQEKLSSLLQKIPKPDLICVPDHEAGRSLATLVSDWLKVPFHCEKDFRPHSGVSKECADALRKSRHLLILDDVIISGSRLERINSALRESYSEYSDFDSVTYLVAVARMESAGAWARMTDALTKKHNWNAQLLASESIRLPYWKKNDCPWCLEERALSQVSQKLATPPPWLTQRLHNLRASGPLLYQDPLLVPPGNTTPVLGGQSPVAKEGARAMEVLFAMSGALQGMRMDEDGTKRLNEDYLVSRVVDTSNLVRFSEGLLRAVLVRSAKPPEWGQVNREELSKVLLEHIANGDHAVLVGEMSLAMYRGSVVYPDIEILVNRLPSDLQSFFRAMHTL